MPRLRAAGRQGFTLTELLLTLILFTTAFLPLLSAISSSLLASTENEASTIALALAQAQIEAAMGTTFSSLVSSSPSPIPNFPAYQVGRQVASLASDLKDVKVSFYWNTAPSATPKAKRATGSVQVLTLETYVLD